ncbi:hypothetical protein NN3_24830 [Nocardia neocaledoniensis NBRC 108232]|uniref:Uncharacterized protein n=1 Tax=Nocardia neocaledoniensis TaxID=236511 RepID=A0A317NXI3_9NOCA|nr:hypothetical protein [Nocardia neocaledoniensis]PWV79695.1 hypothetical protein DFR69_102761 [Nocardia neocaledoniensis]GEM31476.1 hypothetical protein NN3_24830 [Nocardia neocaledoniensis NBRC 108232]
MSVPVFAYYRRPLVRDRIRSVEARIAEVAAGYGCGDPAVRTFVEFESPIRLLWSLGEFLDQRVDADIAGQVRHLARVHGYDYDKMFSYPTPAPALWQLISRLEAVGGGVVLIPSIHHLADLEVPESLILQHLWKNLNASVVWIDVPTRNVHQSSAVDRPHPDGSATGLLGEFEVSPFGAALRMARFYSEECLERSGYAAMAGTIDELMVAIVGPIERRWSGNVDLLDERLAVRLIRQGKSHFLIVEVIETRDGGDDPLDSALPRIGALGIRVHREGISGGGTLTRFEVPLPGLVGR